MEKNWKKLISRRHVRLDSAVKGTQTEPSQAGAGAHSDAVANASDGKEKATANGTAKSPDITRESNGKAAGDMKAVENGARKSKQQEKKPDSETVDLAKRQLLVCSLPCLTAHGALQNHTLTVCIAVLCRTWRRNYRRSWSKSTQSFSS